jgi:DNA-directed RNA polymerase specialized sigma24 family protein
LDNPGAYLRTAIIRLASNRRRGERRREKAFRTVAATLVAGILDVYPSDLDQLRRLRPADRSLVYLSVVERRSYEEIAAMLAISEQSARKRLSRAMTRLRVAAPQLEDRDV